MSNKKSYFQLLKEAVSGVKEGRYDGDYYKGPMIDPILSYDGSAGLETKKDAASILERFYFEEEEDIDTGAELKDEEPKEDEKKEDEKKEELKEEEDKAGDRTEAAGDDEIDKDTLIPAPTQGEDKTKSQEEKGVEQSNSQVTTEALVIEKLIKEMEQELQEDADNTAGDRTEPVGKPEEQKKAEALVKEGEEEDEKDEKEDDEKEEDLEEDAGAGGPPIRFKGAEGNEESPEKEADEGEDKDLKEAFDALISELKKSK
jgi:hypothetical protein